MNESILSVDKYKVIILDNFYEQNECDAILNECLFLAKRNKLKPPEETSAAKKNGVSLKKNSGIWLDATYSDRNISDILFFNRKIFNPNIVNELTNIDIIYRAIGNSDRDDTLLSYYENDDYYDSHFDGATITTISWFNKEPKSFTGGNLIFESDENLTVEYKNNRVVIFPSFLYHKVTSTKVDTSKIGLGFGRFSLSHFIRYK